MYIVDGVHFDIASYLAIYIEHSAHYACGSLIEKNNQLHRILELLTTDYTEPHMGMDAE